jgi:hypothetical protein
MPSTQQELTLAWLWDRSEDLPSPSFSLRNSQARPVTRVRRAEESGHGEDADCFGGGPLLDHLQRAAEALSAGMSRSSRKRS